MSLTLAVTGGAWGLVAADHRRTSIYSDGRVVVSDPGGKIAVVPGGAIAGTGDVGISQSVLEALRIRKPATSEDVARVIAEASAAATPTSDDPSATAFVGCLFDGTHFRAYVWAPTGQVLDRESPAHITWPSALATCARERYVERLARARTDGARAAARTVKTIVLKVSRSCERVSPQFDHIILRRTRHAATC